MLNCFSLVEILISLLASRENQVPAAADSKVDDVSNSTGRWYTMLPFQPIFLHPTLIRSSSIYLVVLRRSNLSIVQYARFCKAPVLGSRTVLSSASGMPSATWCRHRSYVCQGRQCQCATPKSEWNTKQLYPGNTS